MKNSYRQNNDNIQDKAKINKIDIVNYDIEITNIAPEKIKPIYNKAQHDMLQNSKPTQPSQEKHIEQLIRNLHNQHSKILFNVFAKEGFELRFVGGCVRDALKEISISDIDFATDAKPEQIQRILSKYNIHYFNSGLKHGTISAVFDKTCYEITTLRIDKNTDGRHAEVEYTTDWRLDASRRDFSFNGMYVDRNNRLYDYFDGQKDLLNNRLCFIGDPVKRIEEDYLRILRALRFYNRYCKYGLEPNTYVSETIISLASNLEKISGERIQSETIKIFADCQKLHNLFNLNLFNQLGIVQYVFMNNTSQKISWDILIRSSWLLGLLEKQNPWAKLGLILRYNNIETNLIKKRWNISRQNAHILNNINNIKISEDVWDKPLKYCWMYQENLLEFLIILYYEQFVQRKLNHPLILCYFWIIVINLLLIEIPIFKLRATDLLAHNISTPGKQLGDKMDYLRNQWLESNCQLEFELVDGEIKYK